MLEVLVWHTKVETVPTDIHTNIVKLPSHWAHMKAYVSFLQVVCLTVLMAGQWATVNTRQQVTSVEWCWAVSDDVSHIYENKDGLIKHWQNRFIKAV